jgi:hypothetical protein
VMLVLEFGDARMGQASTIMPEYSLSPVTSETCG